MQIPRELCELYINIAHVYVVIALSPGKYTIKNTIKLILSWIQEMKCFIIQIKNSLKNLLVPYVPIYVCNS